MLIPVALIEDAHLGIITLASNVALVLFSSPEYMIVMLFSPGVALVMFNILITAVPLVMLTVLFSPLMTTVMLPVTFSGAVIMIVPFPVSLILKSSGTVLVLLTLMNFTSVTFARYL